MVSVVIVNYKGEQYIYNCIQSVLDSEYKDVEVIVVDNGSAYKTVSKIRKMKVKVLTNWYNAGPSVARNEGVLHAKGEYVLFLDNDTEIEKSAIGTMVGYMQKNKVGVVGAKILRITDGSLDSSGDYINRLGFLTANTNSEKECDVLSLKTAGCMVRRELFERVGWFDESYFMYLEETDFMWRINRMGERVVCIPNAIVYHAFNTTQKNRSGHYEMSNVRYNGCRNYITTLIKNLSVKNIVKILPLHVMCWCALALLFLVRGKVKDSRYIMKGIMYNMHNWRRIWKKRSGSMYVEDLFMTKESVFSLVKKMWMYVVNPVQLKQ